MEAPNSSKILCPPANDTASHPRTLLRPLSDLKNRIETQCFHVESTLRRRQVEVIFKGTTLMSILLQTVYGLQITTCIGGIWR